MRLEAPIVVAEGRDVSVFPSIVAAELWLEAIDVDAGVHRAWDANGSKLALIADGPHGQPTSRRVHVRSVEPAKDANAELIEVLAAALGEKVTVGATGRETLSALLQRFISCIGYR